MEQFKSAIVYGKSVKHQPQRVGLAHELEDEDVGMYYCLVFTSSTPCVVRGSDRSEHARLIWLVTSDHYQAMI